MIYRPEQDAKLLIPCYRELKIGGTTLKRKLKRYQQAGLVALYNHKTRQIRHARTGEMVDIREADREAFGSRRSAEAFVKGGSDFQIKNPLDLIG